MTRPLRTICPPAAPRDDSGEDLDHLAGGELPDRAPLDYVDIASDRRDRPADPPADIVSRILLATLAAAAILGLWIGWPS